jgi:peptide/nickel transport system permease protein
MRQSPVVTVAGLLLIGALTGAVVIEQIFVLPGLGSLAVSVTGAHDLPVVQGGALYFTLIVVAVNLVVDLAYGWLDPKVRACRLLTCGFGFRRESEAVGP